MAKKTPTSQKRATASYGNKKKNRQTGNGKTHDHDHEHDRNGNGTGGNVDAEVNWLDHWDRPIRIPDGMTQQEFEKIVKDYLKGWLEAQNVFETKAEEKRKLKKLTMTPRPGSTRLFMISATLDPPARIPPETENQPNNGNNGPKGGGHVIPHSPPPPPPRA